MRGDADDGALAHRRFVLHRVVADQDVRQRRGAGEERQHQRQEIELVEQRGAAHAGERRAGAGDHQVVAARDLLVVDRRGRAVVLDDALRAPELDRRLAERAQEAGRTERTGRRRAGSAPLSDTTWPTGRRSRWPSPLPCGTPSTRRAPAGVTVTRCVSVSQATPSRVSSRHTSTRPDADPAGACTACRPRRRPSAARRCRAAPGPRPPAGPRTAIPPAPPLTISPRRRIRIVSSEAEQHQERALDELHPGRRHHAGGDDDGGDDDADEQHADDVRQAEQRRDQRAGADHLRNQVEEADDQRADGRRQLDAARVVAAVEGVGEGEAAHPLQRLGDDEERDDPAGEVADRIQEAVVAVEGDHPADAEERRRGQVVAGEGDAVDEPVDLRRARRSSRPPTWRGGRATPRGR